MLRALLSRSSPILAKNGSFVRPVSWKVLATNFASSASDGEKDEVVVVFMDPEELSRDRPLAKEAEAAKSTATTEVPVKVPPSFVKEFKSAKEVPLPSQVGTYESKDRIVNAFVFGQQVEAFEYQPLGVHRTTSGFSCALEKKDLQELRASLKGGESHSGKFRGLRLHKDIFQSLAERYRQGQKADLGPFLFFGKVADADKSNGCFLYGIRETGDPRGSGGSQSLESKGGHVVGLLLSQADRLSMGEY